MDFDARLYWNIARRTYIQEDHRELPGQDTRKILAFLGALPITLTRPYMPSLSITKSSLVYCMVVYSVLSYDVIWSAVEEKRLYDEGDPADTVRHRHLNNILAFAPHFLGICFWMDVPALCTTLRNYEVTQAKFRFATGKPLINRRKRRERYSYVVAGLLLVTICLFLYLITPVQFRFNFVSILAYLYGSMLALCASYVWIGLAWAINDAAEDTKMEFQRQLPFLTPTRVYEFRLLWLSMRNTLDSMGKFRCTTAIYSTGLMTSVYLLYKSGLFVQSGEMLLALGCLLYVAFYMSQVALICTASHRLQEEMKGLVGEVLPKSSLSSFSIKVQREIAMLFLIERCRPASANFHGYTTVNKNLILSFVSNLSTYIVVLLQFNQSGETFGL